MVSSSAGTASSLKQSISCRVKVNSICSELIAGEHKTTLTDQPLFPLTHCAMISNDQEWSRPWCYGARILHVALE